MIRVSGRLINNNLVLRRLIILERLAFKPSALLSCDVWKKLSIAQLNSQWFIPWRCKKKENARTTVRSPFYLFAINGKRFLLHIVRYLLVLSLDYLFLDCISRSCPRKNYIIFLVLPLTRHARPICTIQSIVDLAIFPRIVTARFHGTNTKRLLYDLFNTRPISIRILFRNAFCSEGIRKIYPDSFN